MWILGLKELRTQTGWRQTSRPQSVFTQTHVQYLSIKFIGTKERVYIRKDFKSHRIGLRHQHGCCFIVLEQQYGHHDIMWGEGLGGRDLTLKPPNCKSSALTAQLPPAAM